MLLTFEHAGKSLKSDTNRVYDLSNPVERNGKGVNAYFIPDAIFTPFKAGSFVGSIQNGGACNCETISFCAHGNGSHTENASHVIDSSPRIHEMKWSGLMVARLVTVLPETSSNGDRIIRKIRLTEALSQLSETAVLVRCLPNDDQKKHRRYSGTNPPYFEAEALQWLAENGVNHLLFDAPSVDREDDGGKLRAHKFFFTRDDEIRRDATITELIYVPNEIEDGIYLLNLQLPSINTDAVPSRPLLYPIF
jgi:arylformamidase